jgi:hypothetical protein
MPSFDKTCGFDQNFVASVLEGSVGSSRTIDVDNYYVNPLWGFTGVGDEAHGTVAIPVHNYSLDDPRAVGIQVFPTEDDGLLTFANDHSGVHQWYRWTMMNPLLLKGEDGELHAACSVDGATWANGIPTGLNDTLMPCHRGWYWSLASRTGDPLHDFPDAGDRSLVTVTPVSLLNDRYGNIQGCQLTYDRGKTFLRCDLCK